MKKPLKENMEGSVTEVEFTNMRDKLRDALPPLQHAELRRDLWPEMRRRLERPQVRVPWFDWALLAVSAAAAIFFPALIPTLLYHF
jgi:hypothetical protein